MLSVEDARVRILSGLAPVPVEWVALAQAWGRVLAHDIAARVPVPPADVSQMDGYAVRAADVAHPPATLRVIGAAPAGHPFAGTVAPGEAVRLFTGSVVPAGADAVIAQEDAAREGDLVRLAETARPGKFIRPRGQDFSPGDVLVRAPRRLSPRDVGLIAAANHAWVPVRRRPRIAILATGDEIALPGDPIPPGGLVSSNGHGLAALVHEAGGEPISLGIARDDRAAILAAAESAAGADLLVTTGGASVGEHDLVASALQPQGLALDFWTIAMRPGKPLMWGRFGGLPLLGLPGNPVSAMVCGLVFLAPAIAVLSGLSPAPPPTVVVRLAVALPANDRRMDHLRATLAPGADGTPVATPFATQDSGMLARLAWADCLVLRAPHAAALPAGGLAEAIVLGDGWRNDPQGVEKPLTRRGEPF
jgi:molybdopterin molybdotransferase